MKYHAKAHPTPSSQKYYLPSPEKTLSKADYLISADYHWQVEAGCYNGSSLFSVGQ
jgi:hypothetical protein